MPFITNNEILSWGSSKPMTVNDVSELQTKIQPQRDQRKLAIDGGIPQVLVTESKATMTYNDNGVAVNEYGTIIKGKVHLTGDPRDIRINGFWTLNPELLTCIPSTVYTPIPVLKCSDPPFVKNTANILKLLSE